jgi:serine protease Do
MRTQSLDDRIRPRHARFRAACGLALAFLVAVSIPVRVPAQESSSEAAWDGFHPPFVKVAERVKPAVVFIRTERVMGRDGDSEEQEGPFGNFFRELFPDFEERHRNFIMPGGGSGFIIDEEGHILTNEHVVRNADAITVMMQDEETFEAELVGSDPRTDIAVLRIDVNRELPVVMLGDSEEMLVGDWVLAVGTPFGELAGTVTVGIVSAKGRSDLAIRGGSADYQNYIQTDASINFGNSGGPLVNIKGEAIGVNTAINPSGQGIGFAIPINLAKDIVNQLLTRGRVVRGYMGIRLRELTRELAEGLDLGFHDGIFVSEVIPGGPSDEAGLRKGDIIVEFDDKEVADDTEFRFLVAGTDVGRTVPVKVYREGDFKTLNVTLAEYDEQATVASVSRPGGDYWLGLQVGEINENTRERFRLDDDVTEGVVIIDVEPGSPAARKSMRPGDVIQEIINYRVRDLDDFREVKEKYENRTKAVALYVRRGSTTYYVALKPESKDED